MNPENWAGKINSGAISSNKIVATNFYDITAHDVDQLRVQVNILQDQLYRETVARSALELRLNELTEVVRMMVEHEAGVDSD